VTDAKKRRIAKLRKAVEPPPPPPQRGGVLVLPLATFDEDLAKLEASDPETYPPGRGGYLVVPSPLDAEAWESEAARASKVRPEVEGGRES
jgi:hypothetical protein